MKIGGSKSPVLIGIIAASAGFAALAAVVRQSPEAAPGELKPQFRHQAAIVPTPLLPSEAPAKRSKDEKPSPVAERRVILYAAIVGETPTLSKEAILRQGEDPRERSLAETMKSLGYGDVRVLNVDVERGSAMVDVNAALTSEGFSSTSEAALVEALARTLGQFGEVKRFQLRIDGQIVDSLGHLELSEPIQVIRPGEKADESDSPSRAPSP